MIQNNSSRKWCFAVMLKKLECCPRCDFIACPRFIILHYNSPESLSALKQMCRKWRHITLHYISSLHYTWGHHFKHKHQSRLLFLVTICFENKVWLFLSEKYWNHCHKPKLTDFISVIANLSLKDILVVKCASDKA